MKERRNRKYFLMFSLPALAVYTVCWIFPVFLGFYISFTNWNGIVNLADAQFTGFKNYVNLLYDSILRVSVLNNIKYGIITLIVVPVAAFAVAYLVENFTRKKSFWRTVTYLPAMIPTIVTVFLWKWIYNPQYGILNEILKAVGLGGLATGWITNTKTALYAVTFTSLWKMVPVYFVLFLAGLQSVSIDLIEAAVLDGAGRWQVIRNVTIPCMKRIITIVYVLVFIDIFRVFDLIYTMTKGGPGYYTTEMILTYSYKTVFTNSNAGYGMAIISALTLFVIICSFIQMKIQNRTAD